MLDLAQTLAAEPPADATAPTPPVGLDELEIALGTVARAESRLDQIVAMRKMSFILAEAVYHRAMDDEAAATAARAAAGPGDDTIREDDRPAPANDTSRAAVEAEAGARPKARAASSTRAPARFDAATLFTRLSATFRQWLEMEVRAEETLKTVQGRVSLVRASLLRTRKPYKPNQAVAEKEVFDLMWAAIGEVEENKQDGRDLRAAAVERVRLDPAYEDLADWPLTVAAALICEDLGIKPDRPHWLPDGPAPAGYIRHARPRWSPFRRPSRKPYLKPTGHYLVDKVD